MKNHHFVVLAMAFTITTHVKAQIPNNSFETWINMGTYENPDSWGTLNNTTAAASVFTATKGTPGNPGSSYLKLTSKTVGPAVVNGIAVCGKLDSTTMLPKSGFAYTGQPVSFTGKWQHMIYGSSQGGITVLLTKWNTSLNKRDTVAIANQTLSGMAMSWATFTINFTYMNTDVPDSCIIFLRASGTNPTNNDYLWVDNLTFSGSVAGLENQHSDIQQFFVYPNPSHEQLNLSFEILQSQSIEISIDDMTGKNIYTKSLGEIAGIQNISISTDEIPAGVYFIKITSTNGSTTRKIIID